ncbi:ATP-binding protein [Streptomyces nigrescens]|uniref:ATP-binding protein n=1 Tax=Streptomyces nigrescens TaxID=1920 RepID=UPI0036F8840F
MGKTRLAFQVGVTAAQAFPDGVHVVELAGLHDPGLLVDIMAAALDLRNQRARLTLDLVVEHLRTKRTLLIVDNCEHLLPVCVEVVDSLLRALPELRVLATSRHVLGITGERTFLVSPLRVPLPEREPSAEELLTYSAVALFEQRAAAVLPGFKVTQDNAMTVGRLVRCLDGLPLALELAAARMRTLTVQDILEWTEQRFNLLTGGSRAALPRHQTLRALMDWSHELCSERERTLWARASVFAGGFDLEAAEAVCTSADLPRHEVLDVVHGLVEKSVLIRQEHGGRCRYRMLETVREYGQAHLAASGELAMLHRRHRDHRLDLAARAQDHWFGPDQVAWLTRLVSEHANLRAAMDFCLDTPGEVAAGMALATLPRHYWIAHGGLGEGRRWLSRLLAVGTQNSAARVEALGTYAYLGLMQGAVEESMPVITEYQQAAKQLQDATAFAWAQHHLGLAAAFRGEAERAAELFENAVAQHRAAGDLAGATECMFKLAITVCICGDTDRALSLCRECQTITSEHGETWIRADALFAECLVHWQLGDHDTAEALARQALHFLRPLSDRWGIALCVEVVAWHAAAVGDAERAACLLGILQSLWQAIGGPLSAAPFMTGSHQQCEQDVRAALAQAQFERALRRGAGFTLDEALACVLDKAPAAPASPWDEGPYRGIALTPREREVAELIAAGMSNKDIAASLTIAQRTAESHVGRVLAKLGLTSRSQLAAWIHQRRTPAP